jgi:hypothetical protein
MADEQRTMYDGFSDTGKHSVKWVQITKEFLKLAFVGGRCEASCLCSRCENRRMLSEYEMSAHLGKNGFMSNYVLWCQHGEVQVTVVDESDGKDDVDWMDTMVDDIGRGYNLESEDPLSDVQNFYRILAASEEKMCDGTDVTVLQAVTHLMGFQSKYNILNQCYNDIVK